MYNVGQEKWRDIQVSLESLGPKLFFKGGPMSAVDSIWAAARTIEAWLEWINDSDTSGTFLPLRKEMSLADFPEHADLLKHLV